MPEKEILCQLKKPKKETVAKKPVVKQAVTKPETVAPKKAEHPDAPQLRAEWDAHLNDVNANEVDRQKTSGTG